MKRWIYGVMVVFISLLMVTAGAAVADEKIAETVLPDYSTGQRVTELGQQLDRLERKVGRLDDRLERAERKIKDMRLDSL